MRVELREKGTSALIDVLERAYNVGYDLELNKASVCHFSLPRDDPKWSGLTAFREIWLYGADDRLVDVFRLMPSRERRSGGGLEAEVVADGWATVLQDDVVQGEVVHTNQTVTAILTDLLARQGVVRVNATPVVDASLNLTITVRFAWDNLMAAAWAVRNVVGGYISVEPDGADPTIRKLYLRASPGTDIGKRVHKGFNLSEIAKRSDPTEVVTRLFALGRGEGVNQQKLSTDLLTAQAATFALSAGNRSTLTIDGLYSRYKGWTAAGAALPNGSDASDTRTRTLKVYRSAVDDSANWEQGADERTLRSTVNDYNPGAGPWTLDYVHADYVKADAEAATYGVVTRPWAEKSHENSAALLNAARQVLTLAKTPRVTYELKVVDLARQYPSESFERLGLGDQLNVWDPDLGITMKDRIVRIRYGDIDKPESYEIALSNGLAEDQVVTLARRQRQYETMPDGATNIWTDIFEDNLDATHPYERRIYIPADAVQVNKMEVSYESKPYRYYVSAAGGSSADNSQASSSSSSDANTSMTGTHANATEGTHGTHTGTHSAHAGHGTHTGTHAAHNAVADISMITHDHGGAVLAEGYSDSHTHNTHADHVFDHSVWNHATHSDHTLSHSDHSYANHVLTHTHGIAHTHLHQHTITVTLTPGIVETTTATAVTLEVDGTVVSGTPTSRTDFDLTPYLSRNTDGSIVRGWHTLKLTPNANSRIQGAIVEVVFLQSRGILKG